MLKNKIIQLLAIENHHGMEALFYAAKKERIAVFGKKIFIGGHINLSTWYGKNCNVSDHRKSHKNIKYPKEFEETIAIALQFADSGVNFINLSLGEDLKYHNDDFNSVLKIIDLIKAITGLTVMISPGGISDNRKDAKIHVREKGLLIEESIFTSAGESIEDIADSILMMGEIGAKQMRIMSFVKQKVAPMKKVISSKRSLELKIIAIMRLIYPEVLISALHDVNESAGMKDSMNAGANIVTATIQPKFGPEGVAQNHIETGQSIEQVRIILKELGLEAASALEYKQYLDTVYNLYDK